MKTKTNKTKTITLNSNEAKDKKKSVQKEGAQNSEKRYVNSSDQLVTSSMAFTINIY